MQNAAKTTLKALFLLLIIVVSVACQTDNNDVDAKYLYWETALKNNLPPGTEEEKVKDFLNQTPLEYSYVGAERTFYAIDRNVNRWRVIYEAAVVIQIQLNPQLKVASIQVRKEYSGL